MSDIHGLTPGFTDAQAEHVRRALRPASQRLLLGVQLERDRLQAENETLQAACLQALRQALLAHDGRWYAHLGHDEVLALRQALGYPPPAA